MSTLCVLPPNWSPEINFWDTNGQLAIMPPFNKIYDIDKGGMESSKLMTVVFFMADADEDKNRFARIPFEERKEMIQETYYPDIDWKNKLLQKAIDAYPELCLSAVARTLKDTKEFLQRRAAYLRTVEYNINTMKDIDTAISKNLKIYEDFEKIEQKYIQQEKISRVRGGRKETAVEKGEL